MLITINSTNREIALIVKQKFNKKGTEFFTHDEASQQLGYLNRDAGFIIPPHIHNEVKREIYNTVEVLLIKSGKVRIDFYDEKKIYIESHIVSKGDVVLLNSGGHGFEMLENTELIEIKQGPFVGERDRTRFQPIEKKHLKIIK
jgi:hypothetical protein